MPVLTIEYVETEDGVGGWAARFMDEGLTAYGKTINMAADKLILMLKTKRGLEASKV
jgi:hypothetical protein